MRIYSIELPIIWKITQPLQKNSRIVILASLLTLTILTVIPYYYPLLGYPTFLLKTYSSLSSSSFQNGVIDEKEIRSKKKCDIYKGEWVSNPLAPYYTNSTCWAIHEHQNCMKYGRPDVDFAKWRWKPNECELPLFDAEEFLELLRGKSLAFVGDSIARNQMQSLICLLSKVEYPVDVSYTSDLEFKRWLYTEYNFTMAIFWAPFLVKTKEVGQNGATGMFHLYLDEFDMDWTTQIDEFDYLIISAGHWFTRPTMFYEKGKIIGCNFCQEKNVTDLSFTYSYRKAFKTAFKAINSLENKFKGVTFLRTLAPSHFENGTWDRGGNCARTKPFKNGETSLDSMQLPLYRTQLEQFRVAVRDGKKKGLKFRLIDTTQPMLLRPDGHPSKYGHWPGEKVVMFNDCVHWCLPGPIDTWNDFLLEMLRVESSGQERSIE